MINNRRKLSPNSYRAKAISVPAHLECVCKEIGGAWYAIGNYREVVRNDKRVPAIDVWDDKRKGIDTIEIDGSTLAINHRDMIDSDDNPIFASLDSDKGIGGDILDVLSDGRNEVLKCTSNGVISTYMFRIDDILEIGNIKVIGIQK